MQKVFNRTFNKANLTELEQLRRLITKDRPPSRAITDLDVTKAHYVDVEHPLRKVRFAYHYMEKYKLKPTKSTKEKDADPFIPPFPPGVFLAPVSDTHNLVYNRFRIIKNHLLVATKEFDHQTSNLNNHDFAASFKVIKALEGFGFYNAGKLAGASQDHKHIQIMNYDRKLSYDVIKLINEEIKNAKNLRESFESSLFKFAHKVRTIPRFDDDEDFGIIGEQLERIYDEIRQELRIDSGRNYNMLLTQDWMMLIKRIKEYACDELSMGGITFAGTFIAKTEEQFELLKKKNPLDLLQDLCPIK